MTADTATQTVYQMIQAAVDKNDNRFHRRMDAYWLKQYVTGASDFDMVDAETWDNYAQAVQSMVTRKREGEITDAVRVLEDAVNSPNKDLLITAMGRMHKTLLDGLATCVMDAINLTRSGPDGQFDGRIGTHFQNFIREFFVYPTKK